MFLTVLNIKNQKVMINTDQINQVVILGNGNATIHFSKTDDMNLSEQQVMKIAGHVKSLDITQ